MLFPVTLIATLLTSAGAFTSRSVAPIAFKATTTTRFLSSSSSSSSSPMMPYDNDKMPFYALGTNLALQAAGSMGSLQLKSVLEEDELDIVLEAFCANLRGTNTKDPYLVLTSYGQQLNDILKDRASNVVDRVKKEGEDFLSNFLDCNPEAIQTESGLVYLAMTEGTGESPEVTDEVEVHYHGTLTDGTVVDSSVERGQTITFPLNGVIKGWTYGLQMMKEGGKATLVIPSDLAYGEAGSEPVIPPGATLKFEVELFKVVSSSISSDSDSSSESQDDAEMELHTLPDGTTIRLPKGVKYRMVDAE